MTETCRVIYDNKSKIVASSWYLSSFSHKYSTSKFQSKFSNTPGSIQRIKGKTWVRIVSKSFAQMTYQRNTDRIRGTSYFIKIYSQLIYYAKYKRIILHRFNSILQSRGLSKKKLDHLHNFNPLKTSRRLLYLKPQSVPRCKHFSSRL